MMVQAVMRVMGSDGEPSGAPDEASLTRPPLTSCCAARFVTDWYRSADWGLGTPELR